MGLYHLVSKQMGIGSQETGALKKEKKMKVVPACYREEVKGVTYVYFCLLEKTAIIYRSTERISFGVVCDKMVLEQ